MLEPSEVDEGARGEIIKKPWPHGYSHKQVEDGVKVLFKVLEKASKKSLFQDEGEYIRLQVSSIRIPKNRKKHYRFTLPNGFLKETAEICLFVKDLSKDQRDYENTIRHFKNILAEAGVTCISEVISVNQLMQEYKTYEMKRCLASRFDMFLADNVISNRLHGAVGKAFHRRRKQPNPVNLHSQNLKDEIDKALVKTTLTISGNGAQFTIKIGHTKQSVEQICQNIDTFVQGLRYSFPGKWGNVRSLQIRTDDSISVPLYYSFANPNSIKTPKQSQPPQRKLMPVEMDEISTFPDGYEVMVLPSGDVKVKGKKSDGTIGWLSDLELTQLEDFDPLNDNDQEEFENGDRSEELMLDSEENDETIHIKQEKEYYSDSEEEEAAVEAAEDAYLQDLKAEMVKKDKKRKLEKSDSGTEVKKSKSIPKARNSISTNWKVEVITASSASGTQNVKRITNVDKSWKVDEAIVNSTATEANVRTKGEIVKKKSSISSNSKAKGFSSNLGTKGKVSGNKLGKKKKTKA